MADGEEDGAPALTGVGVAPEIYVDGYQGVAVKNGTVKLNFFTELFDPTESKTIRKCSMVVVMNLATVIQMHGALSELLEHFERDGIIKRNDGGNDD